jgi:hypothetical protein
MSLATPIQSAKIIPLPSTINWGQAKVPGSSLTVVNVPAPIDVTSYATRDFELAYRDLILAALAAEVSITASDVFGMDATRPALVGIPSDDFENNGLDTATPVAFPGGVGHVKPSSVPLDAIQVDRQLYSRDVLLYEALARAAAIFDSPPLTSIAPAIVLSDAWSLAEGSSASAAVSGSLPLKVDLFKLPDVELTGRDNSVASVIANLAYELADLYNRATRLLVQATDPTGPREPEVYTLLSDDGHYRVFIVAPGLTDRNRIVYDKLLKTVTWFSEGYDDHGVTLAAGQLVVALSDTTLTVQGSPSTRSDSQFWRQKSARLILNTYKATPLYYQPNPVQDVSLISGAIYQPDGVYLSAPGCGVTFTPPILPEQAHYRLAVYFQPSRVSKVFGSLNLNGVPPDDSQTATLVGPGLLNWQIKLIEGRYTVQFQFADRTASTDSFEVSLVWNGNPIFEGIILYGRQPGTFILSNSFVLAADGEIGSFSIQRTDTNTGELTIGVVEFVNVREGNLSCQLSATMGTRTSTAIFSSQSGRPDTLFFDFYDTLPGTINLFLNDVNIGGVYVRAIDVRRFSAQHQTPSAIGYRLWKRTFIQLALESVRRAFRENLASSQQTFSASGIWSTTSTAAWMNMLAVVEPRIFQAFRIGRPGDIGQPALTPGSLTFSIDDDAVEQLDPTDTYPISQAFQAWMISAGIYVFNEDFWIDDFDPAIQLAGPITDCDFVTADFSAAAG